jgi:hypothetical protein
MAAWITAVAGALMAQSQLGPIIATPAAIQFTATDPDQGAVAGTPAIITWVTTKGSNKRIWSIFVNADRSTLNGCGTVPTSAIRVSCSSATVPGGGGHGTCAAPFSLSGTPQLVAGGLQGSSTRTYTVNVNFSFTDSWRYIASNGPSCSLTLTYSVTAP